MYQPRQEAYIKQPLCIFTTFDYGITTSELPYKMQPPLVTFLKTEIWNTRFTYLFRLFYTSCPMWLLLVLLILIQARPSKCCPRASKQPVPRIHGISYIVFTVLHVSGFFPLRPFHTRPGPPVISCIRVFSGSSPRPVLFLISLTFCPFLARFKCVCVEQSSVYLLT